MSAPARHRREDGRAPRLALAATLCAILLSGLSAAPVLAQGDQFAALETTSWTQLSQRFLGDRPVAAAGLTFDGSETPQLAGWFETPRYPPDDRWSSTRGGTAAPGSGSPATGGQETAAGGGERVYKDGIYAIDQDYLLSWPENTWRILTGPIRYDQDDWLNVAITFGVGGSLFLIDEAANDFWQDDIRGDDLDEVFDVVNELGDFWNTVYSSIGVYATAELLGAKREKAAALMVLESVVLTALLTESFKTLTGRERPPDASSAFDFNGITDDSSQDSLPSGHASTAFATASVIAHVYGEDNPWVPWVAYPLAGSVALARVNKEKHFLSDVFLGGALGFFVGKMVVEYNPFLEENGFELQPFSQQGAQGISIAYKF